MDVGVERCFESWVAEQDGLVEGTNTRPDGSMLFVARGTGQVMARRGSDSWISGRTAAFTQAELNARNALAGYLGTEIQSGRGANIF